MKTLKNVSELTETDLGKFPVWEFLNKDQKGELAVFPVKNIPVQNLTQRLVGNQVRFANGDRFLALLGNITTNKPKSTKHFLTISIFNKGQKFDLARYHDFDLSTQGPHALADFLGMRIEDVFPISYDVSQFSKGDPAALAGIIEAEPGDKLTRSEIIALAVANAAPK